MSKAKSQADSIFGSVIEIGSPEDRATYLDQACGDDVDLRRHLEKLLDAHFRAGNFLGGTGPDLLATTDQPITESAGTVIGPYKLLEQIGVGGFGVVFMAEQQQPVRRKVALKVIKPGMDTHQVIARFEAERQALALMDHPNIASVLDAGATASGRPYFVMELVKGLPVTEYCDQNQLTPRQRLDLFIHVCQAVQHAHQKGIIHRDIKPSNVLVTEHDGNPVVKVIDFGIAKATGQQLTDKTLFTNFAQMIGTPLYMSPEQAGMSGLDIDTRSDIYSLGVLLYELLTGSTPFDKERLREASFDEIRRIIREEEPAKPSTRISTLGQAGSTVSAQRKSDPQRLRQLLRGDLDWIVMKALDKDRTRRYETANDFSRDIERHLHDEAVLAFPPTVGYKVRKFVRRNKGPLLMAALILVAVVTLTGSVGWVIGDKSARSAQTTSAVLQALQDSQTQQKAGQWAEAKAAATRAEGLVTGGGSSELRQRVDDRLADLVMAARLEYLRLTRLEMKAGEYDDASADRAYTAAFHAYGIDIGRGSTATAAEQMRARTIPVELAVALDDWADALGRIQPNDPNVARLREVAMGADPDDWRNRLRAAVAKQDRQGLKDLAASADVSALPATTLAQLGGTLERMGEHKAAVALLEKAQSENPGDFWINYFLGIALGWVQPPRWDESVRSFAIAAALRPRSATPRGGLGWALLGRGSLKAAAVAFRKAIELDPDYFEAHIHLGDVLGRMGKWDEALAAHRKALALRPTNAWANTSFRSSYARTRIFDQDAWAKGLLVDVEITNSLGMKLRLIPPGEFAMTAKFRAKLSKPFRIGSHEVTVGQFRAFVTETDFKTDAETSAEGGTIEVNHKQYRKPEYTWKHKNVAQGDEYPVAQLSWNDTVKFCEWLSQKEGKTYRLPTEAEWEWACRAGNMTAYHFGDDPKALGEYAWYDANSGGRSHPVGTKKPNAWGLFDMHGNVCEYCHDWDAPLPIGQATDPRGPKYGQYRVLRSYSFHDGADFLIASTRARFVPDRSMMHMGFRVVVEFGAKEFTSPDIRALVKRTQNDGLLIERDKAIASLEETVRSRPKDPELLLRLARALTAQGKCDEAFVHFTSVLEINPNSNIWRERAFLDAKRGQWSKAAAAYAERLKGNPEMRMNEPEPSVEYPFFLLLAGDRDRYRQVCEGLLERLERNPDPGVALHVTRICALSPDTAIDPARIVRQGETIVAAYPTLRGGHHALGLAHYRAGQFDLALPRLDGSLLQPWSSQPMNWVVLAMVHHRLGHAAEARRYLDMFDGWMDQSANAVPYFWGGFPLHPHDWMACLVLRREATAFLGPPNTPTDKK